MDGSSGLTAVGDGGIHPAGRCAARNLSAANVEGRRSGGEDMESCYGMDDYHGIAASAFLSQREH
jgi:hypothetical protein